MDNKLQYWIELNRVQLFYTNVQSLQKNKLKGRSLVMSVSYNISLEKWWQSFEKI